MVSPGQTPGPPAGPRPSRDAAGLVAVVFAAGIALCAVGLIVAIIARPIVTDTVLPSLAALLGVMIGVAIGGRR